MSPLMRELLLKGLVAGTAVRTAKKTSASVGYYVTAGAVGCVSLVFFSMAGYGFLLEHFAMPVAAALTGAVIGGGALAIGLTGYFKLNGKPVRKSAISGDGRFIDNVESAMKSLVNGFEEPIKDNPTMAILLAALAGFAAGDHIGERDNKYH